MKKTGYIGLDVGTSGCKASVFDECGCVLASARREYRFEQPGKGLVELNPDTVWGNVKAVLKEIAAADCEPKMLAVSSIGESVIMLDEQDRVIRNAIVYLDERGPETVDWIKEKMGAERIQGITGVAIRLFFSLNRHLWLQKYEPQTVERARKYFMFEDYMTYLLTGERLLDPSSASKTLMQDAMARDWSREIGDTFGVPLDRFSKIVPAGTVAGKIRPALAEELGLSKELKVVVGCHDQCSATLGAGGASAGDIAAGEGSTESLNLVVSRDRITTRVYEKGIVLEPYLRPDLYMVHVGQHVHGTAIRWFVNKFGADFGGGAPSGLNIYDLANANCAGDCGEVFFLPYLSRANLMDADNRALGMFLGLEVGTDRAQMYRALLEGLCFETKLCFDVLSATGFPIHKIVATGGCSKSPLLMQMKADVLGQPVHILENTDAGVTGLAMICAVADGAYGSYAEAAEAFVRIRSEHTPQRDYAEKYKKYRIIQAAAKELYRNI